MPSSEDRTIQSLRSDLALQIARFAQRLDTTQAHVARRLGIPQPTVSKIINGRVSDLSIELLIRVTVRAGLPVTLQTGRVAAEAGAFVAAQEKHPRAARSALAEAARASVARTERGLTPSERLEAFLEHNQLLGEMRHANRRVRHAGHST